MLSEATASTSNKYTVNVPQSISILGGERLGLLSITRPTVFANFYSISVNIFSGAVGLRPIIWRLTHFGLTLSNFRKCLLLLLRCIFIYLIN